MDKLIEGLFRKRKKLVQDVQKEFSLPIQKNDSTDIANKTKISANHNRAETPQKRRGYMKKIILGLIVLAVLGVGIYFWQPWKIKKAEKTEIYLSANHEIFDQSAEKLSFPSSRILFYKILRDKPFNSDSVTIQIFKVLAKDHEILHRQRVESNLDPSITSFVFALRPDYFRESGNYKIKIFLGDPQESKTVSQIEFTIQ